MKKFSVLLLCVFCLNGCSTAIPPYHPLAETDKPEIAVCIFDTQGAEGGYKGNTDFGQMIAEFTAGLLQQSHYKAVVIPADSDTSNYTYVIKGKFSQIQPGSWAMRFWVGMGTGAARMTVLLKFMRVNDKMEIGSEKFSSSSLQSYGQETSLRLISATLAKKIAKKFTETILQKTNW